MNREEKFIDYLDGLKHEGNTDILENITAGFKSLVEYRVGGTISERQVDIMESEDEIEDIMEDDNIVEDSMEDVSIVDDSDILGDLDTPLDESTVSVKSRIYGKDSDEARNASYQEDQKAGMRSGIKQAGKNLGAAVEMFNRQQESYGKKRLDESDGEEESELEEAMLEVGEGELKGKLSPSLLRSVDSEVESKIRKLSDMIDRQKLVNSDDQKIKYLNTMRGNFWRDSLIEKGISPEQAKGLMPAMNESIEDANKVLLDFVDTAFKIFSIDTPK